MSLVHLCKCCNKTIIYIRATTLETFFKSTVNISWDFKTEIKDFPSTRCTGHVIDMVSMATFSYVTPLNFNPELRTFASIPSSKGNGFLLYFETDFPGKRTCPKFNL